MATPLRPDSLSRLPGKTRSTSTVTLSSLLEAPTGCKDTVGAGGVLVAYVRAHAFQLVRYVLVGAVLAVLNLAFLFGVRTWLHLSDTLAVTAMYVFGVLIHFPSHRWITYSAQDRPVHPQLLRYVVMLVWNFVVMQAVVALAERNSISPYLAVMAATGLTMISNFLAMAHIVFARRRRR